MAQVPGMRVIRGGGATRQHAAYDAPSVEPVVRPVRMPRDDRDAYDRYVRDERRPTALGERVATAARSVAEFVVGHARVFIALAAFVAAIVMLYGPTREWYVSLRSGQDLQTYYEAILSQNAEIRDDLGRLQTHDGIENEARKRGFVDPNETSVVVENLPEDGLGLPDQVEVDYETTWGMALFDFVFGYTPGQWQ